MFWYIVGSYKMIKLVLYSPIYIYVCINIYTFIHISVHKHLCTYTYIHICMNVQVYIIWYACVWNNILSFTFIISLSFSSEFWATLLAFHTINLMSCKSILHVTATNENLNATSFFISFILLHQLPWLHLWLFSPYSFLLLFHRYHVF